LTYDLQFTASLGAVENDPTVFYFEYESDGRWLTGGGSSRVYFCGVLSFPPLAYGTCRPRGCSNIFRGEFRSSGGACSHAVYPSFHVVLILQDLGCLDVDLIRTHTHTHTRSPALLTLRAGGVLCSGPVSCVLCTA
jgi:hypothetical protein